MDDHRNLNQLGLGFLLTSSSSRSIFTSRNNNNNNTRISICQYCGYQTDRISNLRRHLKTMHNNNGEEMAVTKIELKCCNERFVDKAKYREHCKAVHKNGHECQICHRVFTRRALLHRHHSVHSGIKDFVCNMCPYATSHKSNLERHYKTHFKLRIPRNNGQRPNKSGIVPLLKSNSHTTTAARKTIANSDDKPTNLVNKKKKPSLLTSSTKSSTIGKGLHPKSSMSSNSVLEKSREPRKNPNPIKIKEESNQNTISPDIKYPYPYFNFNNNMAMAAATAAYSYPSQSTMESAKSVLKHDCPLLRAMLFNHYLPNIKTEGNISMFPYVKTEYPSTIPTYSPEPELNNNNVSKKPKLSHSIDAILSRP